MKKIDYRKIQILKLIVEEYLRTGDITGSKSLVKKHALAVSSATIRSDMSSLEKMGLIFQPYNSAGRLPTTRGIRVFVDYLMEEMPTVFLEGERDYEERATNESTDNHLYLLVSKLTKVTGEVSFACLPDAGTSYYLGLGNLFQKHMPLLGDQVYNIVKVLENKYHFLDLLRELDISTRTTVFIGEENIIPDLDSCAMIVKRITLNGYTGYLGLLGSLKMDYAFNIAALRNVL